jgi:excisionase family DNA binding protein
VKLLARKQVADILGVSRHQVTEYVKSGEIAVVTLPGRKRERFTIQAVEAFIKRHESGPEVGPIEPAKVAQFGPSAAIRKSRGRPAIGVPHAWREGFRAK